MILADLHKSFKVKYEHLIRLSAERDTLQRQFEIMRGKVDRCRIGIGVCRKAGAIFQVLSDEESGKFQTSLRRLVTAGLQVVFEEPMEFDIEIGVERNVMAVNFYVISQISGVKVKLDVVTAKGGGVADVVSFLLQFLLVYYLPNRQRVIIGDEPWKNLSRDYKARFAEFVRAICEKADMQVIIVTHDDEYMHIADKIYSFSLDDKGLTGVVVVK